MPVSNRLGNCFGRETLARSWTRGAVSKDRSPVSWSRAMKAMKNSMAPPVLSMAATPAAMASRSRRKKEGGLGLGKAGPAAGLASRKKTPAETN